ncbi:membrane protein insertion efficiency factor YidD [Agromyces salentinus]|uniref:Putative membrane protein insertion efficiency factor n=1 Tax=Agromyces salentinus TaxID=269421 RepID=A0ABN2MGX4_9MICO
MRDALLFVGLLPRNLGVLLIRGYRAAISPLYGDVCRYYPSCSAYGLGSVQQRGLLLGSGLTAWRILRCNPWSAGGIDDVRAAKHDRYAVTPFGWVIPRSWAASPAGASRTLDSHAHASHDGCDAASDISVPAIASAPTMSRKD